MPDAPLAQIRNFSSSGMNRNARLNIRIWNIPKLAVMKWATGRRRPGLDAAPAAAVAQGIPGRVRPHGACGHWDYSASMHKTKFFFMPGKAAFVLGGALTLSGCVGYVNGPDAGIYVTPPTVTVAAPANYIYYPGYDVYYNRSLNQYAYLDGGTWVSRPEPRGVSVDVLLASPSVRMDWHDSPANHHAEMTRRYPRNWSQPGARPAQRAQAEKAPANKAQARKTNQKTAASDQHEGK